jgi:hypothetical protein
MESRLRVTRRQILAFRRRVGALDERMPKGSRSLRRAAWAGLQDSMPRAALLSLHARVEEVEPSTWEHPSLSQRWGPRHSLLPIRSPLGDEWLLAEDEPVILAGETPTAPARLLPSGDAYWLLYGAERELLVPREDQRQRLWTPRVWPGALLIEGEIRGTWRRAHHIVRIDAWARLPRGTRDAIEAEANSLPLPGVDRPIEVAWST